MARIFTRRRFLIALLLVGSGALTLWLRRKSRLKHLDEAAPLILQNVCSHFAPGDEIWPSADSLGVPRLLHEKLNLTRVGKATLRAMVWKLEKANYSKLSRAEQSALIKDALIATELSRPSMLNFALQSVVSECAMLYYPNPLTWKAIRYSNPHPKGFSEYQSCLKS